jgi:hypothetical protein
MRHFFLPLPHRVIAQKHNQRRHCSKFDGLIILKECMIFITQKEVRKVMSV